MSRKAGIEARRCVDPDDDAGRVPRWRCEGLLRQNGRVGQMAKTPAITLTLMASDPTALGISRVSLLRGFVCAAIFSFESDEEDQRERAQPAGGRAVGHPSPSLDRRAPCLLDYPPENMYDLKTRGVWSLRCRAFKKAAPERRVSSARKRQCSGSHKRTFCIASHHIN
jgi:hypothetical protein